MKVKVPGLVILLVSSSTLICCALPALLVFLGLGATLASFISLVPQVIWFSTHKELVLAFAALILSLAGMYLYKTKNDPCPLDPKLAELCSIQRKRSLLAFYVSLTLFVVGATVSVGSSFL